MSTLLDFPAVEVTIGPRGLAGILTIPSGAKGLVVFAHGSGSGRLSPRNNHVARGLQRVGLATLLPDLLTQAEERFRQNVFDIPLLADRLADAAAWAASQEATAHLPIGYFGASTGAGAALFAAARSDGRIRAIVSRGGRPDLAGSYLRHVHAPTLLIVGSLDGPVIEMNRQAFRLLSAKKKALVVVPGAGHLFEEPGTLDEVIEHAGRWFLAYLTESDDG